MRWVYHVAVEHELFVHSLRRTVWGAFNEMSELILLLESDGDDDSTASIRTLESICAESCKAAAFTRLDAALSAVSPERYAAG